jgi:hypothetical protein
MLTKPATIHDLFNPNVDAFGRDKHSDYKEDMSGVGSFMRQNRTLYVGRIHVTGMLIHRSASVRSLWWWNYQVNVERLSRLYIVSRDSS